MYKHKVSYHQRTKRQKKKKTVEPIERSSKHKILIYVRMVHYTSHINVFFPVALKVAGVSHKESTFQHTLTNSVITVPSQSQQEPTFNIAYSNVHDL